MFDYETDGLIFTPANKGVASNTLGKTPPARKITWIHSLKWKPKESLETGIYKTVSWYLNNKDWLSKVQKQYEGERLGLRK